MIIDDVLYNKIEIEDPLILKLIETAPFQRLKSINQYGSVNFIFPNKYQTTRYEHSLGVYNVLNKVNAPKEVQIAGLLHDVGHTALSHMFDMAMDSHTEDFHEEVVQKLEGYGEIIDLLSQEGITLNAVDSYKLIKKSLPDIGADRFDYALRDYTNATNESSGFGEEALKHLLHDEEGLLFDDLEIAQEFAELGNQGMWLVIYEPTVAVVYQSTIDIIKKGLKEGWLETNDFLKTDKHVFTLLKAHAGEISQAHRHVFMEQYSVEEVERKEDADFVFIKHKARYFDPRVKINGNVAAVSELSPTYKESLEKTKQKFERAKNGIYYKIL